MAPAAGLLAMRSRNVGAGEQAAGLRSLSSMR